MPRTEAATHAPNLPGSVSDSKGFIGFRACGLGLLKGSNPRIFSLMLLTSFFRRRFLILLGVWLMTESNLDPLITN